MVITGASSEMKEDLGDKIEKLVVMICKLATRDSRTNNSNHKYIRVKVGVKTEIAITIKGTIRTGPDQKTGQVAETENHTYRTEVGLDMNKVLGEVILEET